jgi:membrane protein YdbS with pleckstrin-like domain
MRKGCWRGGDKCYHRSRMQVRPSVKLVLAAYAACGLMEGLIAVLWFMSGPPRANWVWLLMAIPFVGQIMAASRHANKLATELKVDDGRIRFVTGMMSKSTRTLELDKVQDVRVDQTPMQRLLGMGDISLETAGESGRLALAAIDDPHKVADELLNLARQKR